MPPERCEHCRYFHRIGATERGHCQVFPPLPVLQQNAWVFKDPEVHETHACGEWRPVTPKEYEVKS